MTYEELCKANETLKTTNIKGKEYAEVNQRIKVFRMLYPNGAITTEIIKIENGMAIIKASAYDENGNILANGTAYEMEGSSFINKTSYIENCETSAIGRCLGMCGIGIDTSVASYEEVANAIENQKPKKEKPKKFKMTDSQKQAFVIANEEDPKIIEDILFRYNVKKTSELTEKEVEESLDIIFNEMQKRKNK